MSNPGHSNYLPQDFVIGTMETVEPSNHPNNNNNYNNYNYNNNNNVPDPTLPHHGFYIPYQISRTKKYTLDEAYQAQPVPHSEYFNSELSTPAKAGQGQSALNMSPTAEPQPQPHYQHQQHHQPYHHAGVQSDSGYSVAYQPPAPVVYNRQPSYATSDTVQAYPSHLLPGHKDLRERNGAKAVGSRNSSSSSYSKCHSRNSTGSTTGSEYPDTVKPKVATTYWEDAKTVCYQVRARGVLVSRREDTDFVNGTKLLNVMGMTRGKRDGILKTEKIRDVVKVGSMNLKGVWIPYERAHEIARNEGLDVVLYPLFVKDLKRYYRSEGHKLKSGGANDGSPPPPPPPPTTTTTMKEMPPVTDVPHIDHNLIKRQHSEAKLIGELNI